ncbi:hypothetical protein, partial [Acidaminococcus provencensis]|uniref:hypothetical protein n=1 Tax=Acidaminococcus provencensis TaxID=2058289 RepID=UPI0022E626C4
ISYPPIFRDEPNFKHIFAPPAKIFVISESSRYFSELEYSPGSGCPPVFPRIFLHQKAAPGPQIIFLSG